MLHCGGAPALATGLACVVRAAGREGWAPGGFLPAYTPHLKLHATPRAQRDGVCLPGSSHHTTLHYTT